MNRAAFEYLYSYAGRWPAYAGKHHQLLCGRCRQSIRAHDYETRACFFSPGTAFIVSVRADLDPEHAPILTEHELFNFRHSSRP